MQVVFHKSFKKQYKKLPKKIQSQFGQRLELLLVDETNPLLRVHKLKGARVPLISINVTADYRALFVRKADTITFLEIGSHTELYD